MVGQGKREASQVGFKERHSSFDAVCHQAAVEFQKQSIGQGFRKVEFLKRGQATSVDRLLRRSRRGKRSSLGSQLSCDVRPAVKGAALVATRKPGQWSARPPVTNIATEELIGTF